MLARRLRNFTVTGFTESNFAQQRDISTRKGRLQLTFKKTTIVPNVLLHLFYATL